MKIADRVEELLALLGHDGIGVHRALREIAIAVAKLEAREPRWYEISGRETSMFFPNGIELQHVVLVVAGRCIPGGETWADKLEEIERRGYSVRELEAS